MSPDNDRPDPDILLAQVQQAVQKATRGRLKLFFGASAGVGKTYAMLAAAQTALAQKQRLIVGLVETHGRSETAEMLENLPCLRLKSVPYRQRMLQEFDLDAALAWAAGHPGSLILLDELAHSNAPGSRHPKRWQDVEELLAVGVDVWTTMNVQHLESLNDIVSGITGIIIRETVPDRVFDEADEVVVVDLPPDELLGRLKAGKVYLPHQAERAIKNFFRKGNLLALRELALRRTADRVDSEMQVFRRQSAVQSVWPNRESLLACVGAGEAGEKVVRCCARLATQLNTVWHAVHVETPDIPESRRQHPLRVLRLAQELGAVTSVLPAPDAAVAWVRYAQENNLSRLVIERERRRWPWQHAIADRIAALAGDLDVLQVAPPRAGGTLKTATPSTSTIGTSWPGYAAALVACSLTALLATPLLSVLELSNIVMLFLLAVIGVGLVYGRGPAVLAALLGVGLFDFFFVPPRFSFAVSDVEYLLTFAVMLSVALVVGQLTAGLKIQADAARLREHRVRRLYEMSRDLSAALVIDQVTEIAARFLLAEFQARSTLLCADDSDHLQVASGGALKVDTGMAQWVFEHNEAAGPGTDTLPGSACLMLPLKAPMRLRGVLVLEPGWRGLLNPEQRRLLDTCASLLAISLERIHYIDVARKSTVQIESERLRNSLLSTISHDLRTPLTALVGLADTLGLTRPALSAQQEEIARAMKQSALRMSTLVNNLLDMARLEAGAVPLNRVWLPVEEVVGSALAGCATLLDARPVQPDIADNLPLIQVDAALIERVLVNLLENAVKYTPAGSRIRLCARVQDDHFLLSVEDEGPGLPKGSEARIFEKFERGNKETALPGVGLGLAICRAIVEAHAGKITAENRHPVGAAFRISLPLGQPPGDDGTEAANAYLTETKP